MLWCLSCPGWLILGSPALRPRRKGSSVQGPSVQGYPGGDALGGYRPRFLTYSGGRASLGKKNLSARQLDHLSLSPSRSALRGCDPSEIHLLFGGVHKRWPQLFFFFFKAQTPGTKKGWVLSPVNSEAEKRQQGRVDGYHNSASGGPWLASIAGGGIPRGPGIPSQERRTATGGRGDSGGSLAGWQARRARKRMTVRTCSPPFYSLAPAGARAVVLFDVDTVHDVSWRRFFEGNM